MTELGRIEFRPRRRGFVTLGLSTAWLAFLGVRIVVHRGLDDTPAAVWVALAFFGLCAVVAVRRLLRRAPLLTLDGDGFVDGTTGAKTCRVRWSEVSSITAERSGRISLIQVTVHDVDDLLERLGVVRRRFAAIAVRRGRAPLVIATSLVDAPAGEVVAAMTERWEAATGPPGT